MQGVRSTVLRDYYVPSRLVRFTSLRPIPPRPVPRGRAYRLAARIVDANSRMYDGILGFPARLDEDLDLLRDKDERHLLRKALLDERLLTGERRRALVSFVLGVFIFAWFLAGVAVALVDPSALGLYQAGFNLFFYSAATTIFLPTPFELLLASSRATLGVFWTVLISAVAKVAGSWLVLVAGDKANEGLNQLLGTRSIGARILRGLQHFAQRWGYWFVFGSLAVPFMSDTVPLFVAAMLRMKKGLFLLVTFVAIVLRSLLFLYAPGLVGDLVGAIARLGS